MLLPLKYYGDPVLRKKGEQVEKVTPEIKQFIADMLETSIEYKGIGLAAQQVGEAIQLTVIDIRAAEDRSEKILSPFWARPMNNGLKRLAGQ